MVVNETVPYGVDPVYYRQSKVPGIIGLGAFYIAFSWLVVIFRFYCRWFTQVGYWWDDWFALATPVRLLTINNVQHAELMTLALHYSSSRLERRLDSVRIRSPRSSRLQFEPRHMSAWTKNIFILIFFYNPSIAMFKCSLWRSI